MAGDPTPEREFVDTLYRLLANQRRRRIVRLLAERSGSMTFGELVDGLRAAGQTDRDRIALDLHHTHLPMLAEADVVESERDGDRVALTARGRTTEAVRRITDRYLEERRADVQ
ncbi:MAG: hypothetical protein ABEJ81_04345 [Haloferacaceae archaeon]